MANTYNTRMLIHSDCMGSLIAATKAELIEPSHRSFVFMEGIPSDRRSTPVFGQAPTIRDTSIPGVPIVLAGGANHIESFADDSGNLHLIKRH